MTTVSEGKDRDAIIVLVDFQMAIQEVIEKHLSLPYPTISNALSAKACEVMAIGCLPAAAPSPTTVNNKGET